MDRSWSLFLLIAFTCSAAAQQPWRVPSDVAATQLIISPAPDYPSIAKTTNIQGNVILEIAIDNNGSVSVVRAIHGHPFLAPAAIVGVRRWKYTPFERNGIVVPVLTVVKLRFGNPVNHDPEDNAEINFQDKFWMRMQDSQVALNRTDLHEAERHLGEAGAILGSNQGDRLHDVECWRWEMTEGLLNSELRRFDQAAQHLNKAVALQKGNEDSLVMAASLSLLGNVYYSSAKLDLAEESFRKAIKIHEKKYKAAQKSPVAQTAIARSMADNLWSLSRIALKENRPAEVNQQCRRILDLQQHLEQDQRIAECLRLAGK